MRASKSSRRATTSSAAWDGVAARRSAARSVSVTSISWPTAEIVGMRQAATARTTFSSLKADRSSREPPPRATMTTSAAPRRENASTARAISSGADAPWTATGQTVTCAFGKRAERTFRTSRTAAPCRDVTTPMRRGRSGSLRFRAGSKSPSAASRAFSCSKASCSAPAPTGWISATTKESFPLLA